jgi:hypothetical protein
VRWHLQQGHPVITLVKYRNLPGHSQSLSDWDHYIVISGLTPNGFIYNDAAFATTLGYGLEISDVELEYAWNNSSIPHHAMALGLAPDRQTLTFPETPRASRKVQSEPAAARNTRRLAEADEVSDRSALTFRPTPAVAAGPLFGETDRWQDEPDFAPATLDGSPMGLEMEASDQPTAEPRAGPGSEVPKLLVLLGSAWLLWTAWGVSGRLLGMKFALAPLRAAIVALLGLTR